MEELKSYVADKELLRILERANATDPKIQVLRERMHRAEDFAGTVENSRHASVLYLRYITGKSWVGVSVSLGMSKRTAIRTAKKYLK